MELEYQTAVIQFYDKLARYVNNHPSYQTKKDEILERINRKKQVFLGEKSYEQGPKKVLIMSHLPIGDQFTMIPAVRCMSILYDHILLVCKPHLAGQVHWFYRDDPSIELLKRDDSFSPNFGGTEWMEFEAKGYEYKGCFMHQKGGNKNSKECFYQRFYEDLGLSFESIHFSHAFRFIPPSYQTGIPNTPYILIHDHRNDSNPQSLIPDRLIKKHSKWIERDDSVSTQSATVLHLSGDEYRKYPHIALRQLIENAKELHLTTSSFFCMSHLLNLSNVEGLYFYNWNPSDYTDKPWVCVRE